jgi:hypothetical protein
LLNSASRDIRGKVVVAEKEKFEKKGPTRGVDDLEP